MAFRKKHDVTDIYGIRNKKEDPFAGRMPDAPETGFRHSGYYHKYFRGYTEIRKKNSKGRIVVERYYTRPWIVSGLSDRDYWLCRILYACLFLVSTSLFIWSTIQDIPATRSIFVAAPSTISVIALFLLAVMTVIYIFVPKKMTLWDHSSSTKRLKVVSIVAASGETLTAAALTGIGAFSGVQVGKTLVCALVSLLAAGFALAIFLVERKVPYEEQQNNTKLPPGEAHEIW